MKFSLIQPNLMWPGKYGLVRSDNETNPAIGIDDWESIVAHSDQLAKVLPGRSMERPTYFFSSQSELGRVEVVYQHGYLWPTNPPPAGQAIMVELVEHINAVSESMD